MASDTSATTDGLADLIGNIILAEIPRENEEITADLDQATATKVSIDSFPQFPNLPIELRLKVFRLSFPAACKLHVVKTTKDQTPSGFHCPRPPPITLRINAESRAETLQHYHILLPNNQCQRAVTWFDPKIDSVYFREFQPLFHGPELAALDGTKDLIQRVEFDDLWWAVGYHNSLEGITTNPYRKPRWNPEESVLGSFKNLRLLTFHSCPYVGNGLYQPGGASGCLVDLQNYHVKLREEGKINTVPEVIVEVGEPKPNRPLYWLELLLTKYRLWS